MYPSKEPKKINWVAFRIAVIAALFAVGTVMLTARAYMLQIVDSEGLQKRAEKQRTKVIHLEARRGSIYDRAGDQLAVSLEVNSVYANPRKIVDKAETSRQLAEILEMNSQEIAGKLDEDKAFVWVQRRISPYAAERIKKVNLSGITIGTEYQRFYPMKNFAAHAIGFAGLDSSGLEGLELFYDQDLKSDPIPVTAQTDAKGRPVMFTVAGQDPKRKDIHLTIDRNIQYITEKELEEGVQQNKAKAGTAVVMDADSGEILALAVRPTYNLNVFHKVGAEARRNRAVADTFEPGSTFKVFLAASVLELGKVTPDDLFDCKNGTLKYNGSEIHDIVPHKTIRFEDVITQSSNIGVVLASERLKKIEFYRMLHGFGFGSLSGIDLPGERPGVLPIPSKWSALTKANIAFGQGISVNAVQLTSAFASAINGGNYHKPHLVRNITNSVGDFVKQPPKESVKKVITDETSNKLVEILRATVSRGTGKAAAIAGLDVIGKTGTAQKADPSGGYSQDRYVASFIGAIMDMQPRLVILVIIDEPVGKIRTGGKMAAPVFRRIGEQILALCGTRPPSPDIITAAAGGVSRKSQSQATQPIPLKKGSKPGEWIVPDFKGFDTKQVIELSGKMKCDLSLKGSGIATEQNPKPGEVLREGAPLFVSFEGHKP